MKDLVKNKFTAWLIVLLILANIVTLVFFWLGHFKLERDNAPKEILVKELHFSEDQKNIYFNLAKEHHDAAETIRRQIIINKENFFQLLKSNEIIDSVRNNAALQVSLSIQSLDILTFEHFKKVRAICTNEQKPKFDELVQHIINTVNNPQQGPPPFKK
jgi:protein CpxP